jgi:hypothetical protein
VLAWKDFDPDAFVFNWLPMVSKTIGGVRYLTDTDKSAHWTMGTNGDDNITMKTGSAITIQGGGGNDVIETGVNATRDRVYGDWEPNGSPSPDFQTRGRAGNDVIHVGNGDWATGGGGADVVKWHPLPGGYFSPGTQFGFSPGEGDTFFFAHDEGFTLRWTNFTMLDKDTFRVNWFDLEGHDSDPLLDGQWIRQHMAGDGLGNARSFTRDLAPGETVRHEMLDWLNAHDGEQHPLSNDVFMF